MSQLTDILPTPESLLALSPGDLEWCWSRCSNLAINPYLLLSEFVTPFYTGNTPPYSYNTKRMSRAVAEAWQWLVK